MVHVLLVTTTRKPSISTFEGVDDALGYIDYLKRFVAQDAREWRGSVTMESNGRILARYRINHRRMRLIA